MFAVRNGSGIAGLLLPQRQEAPTGARRTWFAALDAAAELRLPDQLTRLLTVPRVGDRHALLALGSAAAAVAVPGKPTRRRRWALGLAKNAFSPGTKMSARWRRRGIEV